MRDRAEPVLEHEGPLACFLDLEREVRLERQLVEFCLAAEEGAADDQAEWIDRCLGGKVLREILEQQAPRAVPPTIADYLCLSIRNLALAEEKAAIAAQKDALEDQEWNKPELICRSKRPRTS